MEASVSIFQESPFAGEPRARLLYSIQNIFIRLRYCDKETVAIFNNKYNSLVLSFLLLKI